MHPKGSISYRHWLGLVQNDQDKRFSGPGGGRDASGISACIGTAIDSALGRYDMDNMKPRGWYSDHAAYELEESKRILSNPPKSLVDAAGLFLGNLRSCLKDAWFSDEDPRRGGPT